MSWDEIPNIDVGPFEPMRPDLLSEVQGIPLGEAPQPRRPAPKKPVEEPRRTTAFNRTGFATGVAPMMNHGASGAYHAAIGSAQQGKALGDMIEGTMSAWQDENDSRVSQEREMRRMLHEQEIERMRQETERMKVEALLKRLQMESGGGNTVRFPGGSITRV